MRLPTQVKTHICGQDQEGGEPHAPSTYNNGKHEDDSCEENVTWVGRMGEVVMTMSPGSQLTDTGGVATLAWKQRRQSSKYWDR